METTVKLKLGFAALMIVSGIGVAMYPVVSNAVAQRHASSVIESYNDTVQSMDAEKSTPPRRLRAATTNS